MKVETTGMMSGIRVCFEPKDLSADDQRELFVMMLRHLGFIKALSNTAIAEIDAHLIALANKNLKDLLKGL